MTETKDYWEDRPIRPPSRIANAIKRSRLSQGLVDLLFSLRASDEVFLARELGQRRVRSVLDIACGSGKAVIPSVADYVIGVDIAGFPAAVARSKGYDECVEYSPPDYAFDISRQVDAVTAINLNAHIPLDAYRGIVDRALRHLRPGGVLIIINEYDNDGLSYRLMHRNPAKFDRFVKGMEHWHLHDERAFLAGMKASLQDLRQVRRRPLTCGLLPAIHYYAYAKERDPGPLLSKAFLLADIPLSVANYVQGRLSSGFNKCFTVGYVYEKPR